MNSYLQERTAELAQNPQYSVNPLGDTLNLVMEMQGLERMKAQAEAKVRQLTLDIDTISSIVIPQLMDRAHVSQVKMNDGCVVNYTERLFASLPKRDTEAREKALDWICENGGADVVKTTLVVSSPTAEQRKKLEGEDNVECARDIHPQTLKKFLSDAIGLGGKSVARMAKDEVPSELNLFLKRVTKIIGAENE